MLWGEYSRNSTFKGERCQVYEERQVTDIQKDCNCCLYPVEQAFIFANCLTHIIHPKQTSHAEIMATNVSVVCL